MGNDTALHQFVRQFDSVTPTPRGLELQCGYERYLIECVREDIVRLRMSRGGCFLEKASEAVCVDVNATAVEFDTTITPTEATLKTSHLHITLTLDSARLSITRTDGSPVLESTTNPQGQSLLYGELNEHFVLARKTSDNDAIFGLGEKTGRSDRQGREFTLWNTDILSPNAKGEVFENPEKDSVNDPRGTGFDPYYVSIPFYYKLDGTTGKASGHFIDNPHRAEFSFKHKHEHQFAFHGGQYDEYIFAGPDIADILEGFTWLTGRMPLPPLWSLGHHQCRWTNYHAEDFRELAEQYRKREIPCDSLWFDINYMRDYQVFTWNTDLLPDVVGLLGELRERGFHNVTIIDPGIAAHKGYEVYDEGMARDMFCRTESGAVYGGKVWPGKTVFPDFPREEVRLWWAELVEKHLGKGLSGIWNDMNEPASNPIPVHEMRFEGGSTSHNRYHNEYGTLMCEATREGSLKAMPEQRPFVLTRAGSAGVQRTSAIWTGDCCSHWRHLAMQVPMLCGLGVSGQAFVGADIAGFFLDSEPELAIRWAQCGAFYPFMRNHSSMGTREQYPWSFGELTERCYKEAVELRYRLLPYLYSDFSQAHETGKPVMRGLYYDFQYDAYAREVDDQFLCGDALMVAPALEPGMSARTVYFPKGQWYDFFTEELIEGPCVREVSTPIDHIPVFVRAGSVIPSLHHIPLCTDRYVHTSLQLTLYPQGENSSSQSLLYEDDGISFAATRGAYLRSTFTLTQNEQQLTLDTSVHGSSFPEHKRERFAIRIASPSSVWALRSTSKTLDEPEPGQWVIPSSKQGFTLNWQRA